MKINSYNSQAFIYLEGNENIKKIMGILEKSNIRGIPTKEISSLLYSGMNALPTIGLYEDDTDTDEQLVSDYNVGGYKCSAKEWKEKSKSGKPKKMKVDTMDNIMVLYFSGNENVEKLERILSRKKIEGLPAKKLIENMYLSRDAAKKNKKSLLGAEEYRKMVAGWHREWVFSENDHASAERGTTESREYAARFDAFYSAGSPERVDWTKPGSIEIPEAIREKYGLTRKRRHRLELDEKGNIKKG